MTMDDNTKISKTTFSQREGRSPPPIVELGSIPKKFRHLAWRHISGCIDNITHPSFDVYTIDRDRGFPHIIWSFKFDVLEIPHDEIPYQKPSLDKEFSRSIILDGDYDFTITFIEYILRHEYCPNGLSESLIQSFEDASTAYQVIDIDGEQTVIPRISREAGEAARQAVEILQDGGMDSAASHLRQAAEHIGARQYADTITDSIHAVESVARAIDQKSKTLASALDSLEKTGVQIHPALKKGFKNLYGYTNDEQGLRHALLDQDVADVGLEEAVFMFGACASFAAYLTQKHRQAGGA